MFCGVVFFCFWGLQKRLLFYYKQSPYLVAFHLLLGDPKPPHSPSEDFLVTLMCLFCMYLLSLGLN